MTDKIAEYVRLVVAYRAADDDAGDGSALDALWATMTPAEREAAAAEVLGFIARQS